MVGRAGGRSGQRSPQDGCHGSAAQRAGVVEHILDTLVQGGHDHIAEQSVEARQQQSAQHHGDEDLDGGVDVALTGRRVAARRMALVRMELAVFLINFFM